MLSFIKPNIASALAYCMKITFLEHPVRISKMEMVFFVIVPNLMDHFHHMPQWEEETPKIVPFFITITPACWLRLLCDFRWDVTNQSLKVFHGSNHKVERTEGAPA